MRPSKKKKEPQQKDTGTRPVFCGKKHFATEEQAIQQNKQMRPYFCVPCNAWHLTSGIRGRITKIIRNAGPTAAKDWERRKTRRRPPKWKQE